MARAVKRDEEVEKIEEGVRGGMMRRIGLIKALAFVFFVVWIAIGLVILGLIFQFSQGKLENYVILSKVPAPPPAQTETVLPKIGTINIACAEKALKQESIQKLVGEYDYDITKLEASEKTEFEKCIVAPPQPSPTS